ncbi:uracil phosphoribosyltransferase [Candidatus Uabimicrobium amorphum]|uniref:Uracil phosphoribosyltransferase n=1 Tax=Uabimicrobium amorphum TaxID=2596890 RepID=A0A5S9IU68_UABAM|nr:uracil phosphoribosyltransferase [Candidatus Uabimicrobium amorphum]BBM87706.1 uracil phosphoribosyltransferase [Candidatus Uabimicrobium amorphum]
MDCVDCQYQYIKTTSCGCEVEHEYAQLYPENYKNQVHILHSTFALSMLHAFCNEKVAYGQAQSFLPSLYNSLLFAATSTLPVTTQCTATRMHVYEKERGFNSSSTLQNSNAVVVSVLRAGNIPAMIISDTLALSPNVGVYNDYVVAERVTQQDGAISGTAISGCKLSSKEMTQDEQRRILIIPEPMGATASTTDAILSFYQEKYQQQGGLEFFDEIWGLYLIVTPEFITNMAAKWPQTKIFSHRLDRGLSTKEILATKLGSHVQQEKGLTANGYIVPGAGDVGNLLSLKQI